MEQCVSRRLKVPGSIPCKGKNFFAFNFLQWIFLQFFGVKNVIVHIPMAKKRYNYVKWKSYNIKTLPLPRMSRWNVIDTENVRQALIPENYRHWKCLTRPFIDKYQKIVAGFCSTALLGGRSRRVARKKGIRSKDCKVTIFSFIGIRRRN